MEKKKRGPRIRLHDGAHVADTLIKALGNTVTKKEFSFGDVSVVVTRDHILPSQCHHPESVRGAQEYCQVCEYAGKLELPQLPEMVFPNNSVTMTYRDQPYLKINFNALDALKHVDVHSFPDVEVESSKEWQRSKSASQMQRSGQPFDWTYTSSYKGTVEGFRVVPSDETISIEKLKRRDPINFYSQLMLYEDELADHGCSEVRNNVLDPNVLYDYLPTVEEETTKLMPPDLSILRS